MMFSQEVKLPKKDLDMKKYIFMVLCFASVTVFTKPLSQQQKDYLQFGKTYGYAIPTEETAQRAYINGLIEVFGITRKGRIPACIRMTVQSFVARDAGWLRFPRLTPSYVSATARQLKDVADIRFGNRIGNSERVDAAEEK